MNREQLLMKRYKKLVGQVQDATACGGDLDHYAELQAARAAMDKAKRYPGLVVQAIPREWMPPDNARGARAERTNGSGPVATAKRQASALLGLITRR